MAQLESPRPAAKGQRVELARVGALFALLAVVIALAFLVVTALNGTGGYTLHARFYDAGQIVPGDLVNVAGQRVGKVAAVTLADNGQADVELDLSDGPLHRGTHLRIRAVGQAGIANRYIDVTPGPKDAPELPDGAVLPTQDTHGIVDIDQVLNGFDARSRRRLKQLLREGADIYAGSTARAANAALARLNPAIGQTARMTEELVRSEPALERLVSAGAQVAATLAGREGDVEGGVRDTARTLRALAAERRSLTDLIGRAPAVLDQAQGTLARTRTALAELDPVVQKLRPLAEPTAELLRRIVPTGRDAIPVLGRLRALLPALDRTLQGLPPLTHVALPAVKSTVSSVRRSLPVFRALRIYAPDVVLGLMDGFLGNISSYYDAAGHYGRIVFGENVGLLTHFLGKLEPPIKGPLGNVLRTGLTARCPGAAAEPAADGSNPIHPEGLCDPKQDHRP